MFAAGCWSSVRLRMVVLGMSVTGCLVLMPSASRAASPDELVIAWNAVLLQTIRVAKTPPPAAARAMAMVHVAMFDAVNAIERRYEGYRFRGLGPRHASREATAAVAAHRVLSELYPSEQARFDTLLQQSLAGLGRPAAHAGSALGAQAAAAILRDRRFDRSQATVGYTPGSEPGDWQPTPPAFAAPLLPQWPRVTPFALPRGRSFRPLPPPELGSWEYAVAFEEVRSLGRVDSAERTPEQTEIALFWADGAGTATPPGHWNSIAQTVAAEQRLNLLQTARLFALLNIALADAGICAWDAKYEYSFWRPITGIQFADLDGNTETAADPTWTPLLVTPPFPSYTSGHSTFSSSAATVLAQFVGSDDYAFSTTHDLDPTLVRHFDSFSAAAAEAGQSRIYGGIHWQFDNEQGLLSGAAVGDYVSRTQLLPHHRPPAPGSTRD